jgi:glycerol-3-phosphate acyltransferase PlsY
LFLLFSYLLAAVPFGLVVTTLYGADVDIRAAGSGNIGATNVARVYGWRLGAAVIALDASKGLVPVLLARAWWPEAGLWWPAVVLAVCFVGHCFPVYLEFHGGKGVATGAGGLLALSPWVTLPAVALWIALLGLTGRSSVAALGATTGAILLAWWLDPPLTPYVAALALGVVATHVPNLRRLLQGEERPVVPPVRWNRAASEHRDPRAMLEQGPAGGQPTSIWKEERP